MLHQPLLQGILVPSRAKQSSLLRHSDKSAAATASLQLRASTRAMVLKRAAMGECPKKVAALVDLANLSTPLRQFAGGQSQMSHLSFFLRVWSHIKDNNLQDPTNKNIVNCDDKLKSILLGKPKVELSELPALVKLHFPKASK